MATRDYELTLVVDTQPQESSVDDTVQRYEELLSGLGAEVLNTDRWGARKLAYEIQKRQQGDYTLVQFQAEPASIGEVDRACRLDEVVLRHLIVHVEEGWPVVVAEAEEDVSEAEDEATEDEQDGEAEDESTDEDTELEEDEA